MRILLTRPQAASLRFARLLKEAGHEAILSPVIEIVATGAPIPDGAFDALVATSANALEYLQRQDPAMRRLAGLPLYVVGERTAEAARAKGFRDIRHAAADAATLGRFLLSSIAACSRILYLAGHNRKPLLESELERAGHEVSAVVVYRAMARSEFSAEALAGLGNNEIHAVIHFSRRSAELFAGMVQAAGIGESAKRIAHICFSADVAAGLDALGPLQVEIAQEPEPGALLAALEKRAV